MPFLELRIALHYRDCPRNIWLRYLKSCCFIKLSPLSVQIVYPLRNGHSTPGISSPHLPAFSAFPVLPSQLNFCRLPVALLHLPGKSTQLLELLRTQSSIYLFSYNIYSAHQRSYKGPRDRSCNYNIHFFNMCGTTTPSAPWAEVKGHKADMGLSRQRLTDEERKMSGDHRQLLLLDVRNDETLSTYMAHSLHTDNYQITCKIVHSHHKRLWEEERRDTGLS